jgi:hypothetical protein
MITAQFRIARYIHSCFHLDTKRYGSAYIIITRKANTNGKYNTSHTHIPSKRISHDYTTFVLVARQAVQAEFNGAVLTLCDN